MQRRMQLDSNPLTPSRPLLPYKYSYKASCTRSG